LKSIRWGIVSTGGIAKAMASQIRIAAASEIRAVSSRHMASAQAFARAHDVPQVFDDWRAMIESGDVDAIYVATPTSVREEICIAAAKAGKHVLGEKPFASVASVRRIIAACRENDVAFMDGTHFVHHPRTRDIRQKRQERLGVVGSIASAFQFSLRDRGDIRYDPELEPMGAIGDAGWYNMRATVEYLSPDAVIDRASTHIRRDNETGAVIGGAGVLAFTDGSTSTWNCGFDAGGVVMDLRITGTEGAIFIDDFLGQNPDGSADFVYRRGGWDDDTTRKIAIPSAKPGAALMFEDMAAAAADSLLREQWMRATERTQALLDAVWMAAAGAS